MKHSVALTPMNFLLPLDASGDRLLRFECLLLSKKEKDHMGTEFRMYTMNNVQGVPKLQAIYKRLL